MVLGHRPLYCSADGDSSTMLGFLGIRLHDAAEVMRTTFVGVLDEEWG